MASQRSTVMVVTPEKLGYLFRQGSRNIHDTQLFIFDELHNIGQSDRGWLYEELISLLLLHPNTSGAKMIFLSAVMPNHLTVQEWVDTEKLPDTISELWQPTRLLKGAISFRNPVGQHRQGETFLPGDLIYARHKGDLESPMRIRNLIQSQQVLTEPNNSLFPRLSTSQL